MLVQEKPDLTVQTMPMSLEIIICMIRVTTHGHLHQVYKDRQDLEPMPCPLEIALT